MCDIDVLFDGNVQTQFTIVKNFPNGGVYSEHLRIDKNKSDYKLVKNVGIEFARMGKIVKANAEIKFDTEEYKKVFGALVGTKYERKCPDLLVDNKFYEVKSYEPPFKSKKIKKMLRFGLYQSNNLILNNNKGASDRYIKKLIYDRIRLKQAVNEVWLYEKGKIRLLYKKQ